MVNTILLSLSVTITPFPACSVRYKVVRCRVNARTCPRTKTRYEPVGRSRLVIIEAQSFCHMRELELASLSRRTIFATVRCEGESGQPVKTGIAIPLHGMVMVHPSLTAGVGATMLEKLND